MDYLPDDYVQCPHEKSHVILKTRMQRHLVRCNRNNENSGKKTCPYNTTHLIEKSKFEQHLKECPNGNILALHKNVIDSMPYANQNFTPSKLQQTSEQVVELSAGEDWSDSNVPTYNPKAHCNNSGVLLNMIGGTPSERRAFREAQHERLLKRK